MLDAEAADAARLRQSILKAAFEGRLVPQDPADEPASALLARLEFQRARRQAWARQKVQRMNAQTLVAKVWNFAHVLRDQGVSYQAYISQISYLSFSRWTKSASPRSAKPRCSLPVRGGTTSRTSRARR